MFFIPLLRSVAAWLLRGGSFVRRDDQKIVTCVVDGRPFTHSPFPLLLSIPLVMDMYTTEPAL